MSRCRRATCPDALGVRAIAVRGGCGGRPGVSWAANAETWLDVGVRLDRTRRALQVTKVAREAGLRRVLAEIGAVGNRQATREMC